MPARVAQLTVDDNGDGTFHVHGTVNVAGEDRQIDYNAPSMMVQMAVNMATSAGALR